MNVCNPAWKQDDFAKQHKTLNDYDDTNQNILQITPKLTSRGIQAVRAIDTIAEKGNV